MTLLGVISDTHGLLLRPEARSLKHKAELLG
jgi:hypothetical protein